jgi:tetratricopeptide (TPR) repeat protein
MVLLIIAVIGKLTLYLVNPPNILLEQALVLPFPVLLILESALVVFTAIISIECIRILTTRSISWRPTKHFLILTIIIAVIFTFRLFFIFPKHSTHYYRQGWSLAEKKECQRAIQSLNISIDFNPQNIKAYLERGYVQRESGDLTSAIKDFNKAIALDPMTADAYEGRGYAYYLLHDNALALQDWDKAISIDPHSSARLRKWIDAIKNN